MKITREEAAAWTRGEMSFKNEVVLNCVGLGMDVLPPLPDTLSVLDCAGNNLESLPPLPPKLHMLSCGSNELRYLPELPSTLVGLYCSKNVIGSLPPLPSGLTILDCSDNSLESLPPLPSSIRSLYCCNNRLTRLPELPQEISLLYCRKNPLEELPELPRSLNEFSYWAEIHTRWPFLRRDLYRQPNVELLVSGVLDEAVRLLLSGFFEEAAAHAVLYAVLQRDPVGMFTRHHELAAQFDRIADLLDEKAAREMRAALKQVDGFSAYCAL